METNFEIEENYAVQLNGIHIDLHNNFEFKNVSYEYFEDGKVIRIGCDKIKLAAEK